MNWTKTPTIAQVKLFICAKRYFPHQRKIGEYFNLKGKMKGYISLFHKRGDGKGDPCLNHLRAETAIECWLGTIFPAQLTLIINTAMEEITHLAPD